MMQVKAITDHPTQRAVDNPWTIARGNHVSAPHRQGTMTDLQATVTTATGPYTDLGTVS